MSRPSAPKGSELGDKNAKSLDIDEPALIIESGKTPGSSPIDREKGSQDRRWLG
jgi:hypothetical protein